MRLLFLLLFSFSPLCGGIEDHFKKPTDKSNLHQMRNIDFIYMINLDERPQKFASCTSQLHPLGIFPYRFSAVNGWTLPLSLINEIGVTYQSWMSSNGLGTCYFPENGGEPHHEVVHVVGRNYFCHCMARGTIGIVLSHLSVLQDAYDSGYETIWVMEDDIQVIRNPHHLSDLIDELDTQVGNEGWDMLFTDQDTKDRNGNYVQCLGYAWRPNFIPPDPGCFGARDQISPQFRKIGARYGAYSFIIRRAGMKKILDFIKQYGIFLPYDMEFYFPEGIRLFTVMDDVVSTQPQALSDNGSPGYLLVTAQRKKFRLRQNSRIAQILPLSCNEYIGDKNESS